MAKKKTGIRVIIYRTKRKVKPYSVDSDWQGPMDTLPNEYGTPRSAKRGAIRNLKAWSLFPGEWNVTRQDEAIPVTFEQVGK